MSWGRVDDGLDDNPKFAGIPLAAAGLWLMCLPQALRRSDGFVPSGMPQRFAGADAASLASELVDRNLWELADRGGWRYHDFQEYSSLREKRSEAGAKGAAARWQNNGKTMATDASRGGTPVPVPVPEELTPLANARGARRSPSVEIANQNAGFVGAYVDACRDAGAAAVSDRDKGRVGKAAKALKEAGHDDEAIVAGIRELARRNESPAILDRIVGDVERIRAGTPIGRIRPPAVVVPTENPHDARARAVREGRA